MRLHPWWQLEQWCECRGIHAEFEQCTCEYEQQHWLSLRSQRDIIFYLRPEFLFDKKESEPNKPQNLILPNYRENMRPYPWLIILKISQGK